MERKLAFQLLKKHKRAESFQAILSDITIDELENLGCEVSPRNENGVSVVSSIVPLGKLTPNRFFDENKLETIHGVSFWIFFKIGGFICVPLIAIHFNMGLLTAGIWFWGWVILSTQFFVSEKEYAQRLKVLMIAAFIFVVGIIVQQIGWSAP